MKIYMVRHGEVENPENVLYGRLPGFHLSQIGRDHIHQVAQEFKNQNIGAIYSSPLERTKETSSIIAEEIGFSSENIMYDERIIEADCKNWAGKPIELFREECRKYNDPLNKRGIIEPMLVAGQRVYSLLKDVSDTGVDSIVVSHGDPIMGALILIEDNEKLIENYLHKGNFVRIDIIGNKWTITEYNQI